jgi:hypothetical protein
MCNVKSTELVEDPDRIQNSLLYVIPSQVETLYNLPGPKLIRFSGEGLIFFAYPHRDDANKPGGGA